MFNVSLLLTLLLKICYFTPCSSAFIVSFEHDMQVAKYLTQLKQSTLTLKMSTKFFLSSIQSTIYL